MAATPKAVRDFILKHDKVMPTRLVRSAVASMPQPRTGDQQRVSVGRTKKAILVATQALGIALNIADVSSMQSVNAAFHQAPQAPDRPPDGPGAQREQKGINANPSIDEPDGQRYDKNMNNSAPPHPNRQRWTTKDQAAVRGDASGPDPFDNPAPASRQTKVVQMPALGEQLTRGPSMQQ